MSRYLHMIDQVVPGWIKLPRNCWQDIFFHRQIAKLSLVCIPYQISRPIRLPVMNSTSSTKRPSHEHSMKWVCSSRGARFGCPVCTKQKSWQANIARQEQLIWQWMRHSMQANDWLGHTPVQTRR